jgi:transcriptional regulator with XRE-family HTH domain
MEKQLRKVMEEHNQKLREYHPLAQYWFEGVNTAQKVVLNRYKNQLWETAKRISKQENLNLDFSPDLKNGVIPDERLEEVIENCSKYLKNLSLLRDDSATVGMKNTWYGALDRFYDIREAVEEKKEPSQKPTLAELCNDYTNPSSTKGQVLLELAKQLRFRDPCEIYAKNPEEHEKLLETKKNMEFLAGLAREGYSVKTNPEFKDFMPKWAHKTVGKAIDRAADYIVDKGDSSGLIGWAEWACDGISRFSKNAAKVLDTVGKAFDKVSGGNFYVKDASRYVNRETLAEVCGVSFATIENWSMGRAVMSDENMRKIAEFYDLDLEDEKSHAANTASAVAEAKRPPANKNPSESVNTGYPAVLPQIDPFEDLNLEEALNNQPTPNQNINPRPRSIPPVKEKSQERDVLAL